CDRDPERFHEFGLLWNYKWVINSLSDFPQITMRQILDAFADMEKRYTRAGLGLRPLWQQKTDLAMNVGDRPTAQENYCRWSRSRRGIGSDCPACERSFQVRYLLDAGRPRQALKTAEPLLLERMRCAEVPHSTYARVLLPLVRTGEVERAMG